MRIPDCKNPDHPPSSPRNQMICVEEHESRGVVTHYVFACVPCRDIRKILSAQVVSTPKFREYVQTEPRMQAYKKAVQVMRDPTGKRIRYFK